jgi:predicted DCC family thiol-disulfide oxidoreductase YuxK
VARDGRPAILYDRDCGFCRWSLAQLLRWDHERRLRPVALQDPEADVLLHGMDEEAKLASAHLVCADGRIYSGGRAVAPLLRLLPGGAPLARVAGLVPAPLRIGYDWVANHRAWFGRPLSERAKERATRRIDAHARRGDDGRGSSSRAA